MNAHFNLIKKKLKDLYHKQLFHTNNPISVIFNPFYIARSGLFKAISKHSNLLNGSLLDVGCGIKPYQNIFSVTSYIGLDLDSKESKKRAVADYFYDGKTFPFPENSFDSILCNEVLEHVFDTEIFLSEIKRVLKPNGIILLTVPFVWVEHEEPYDFARYTSFGALYLLNQKGFRVKEFMKIGTPLEVIFQLGIVTLYKKNNFIINSLIFFIVPFVNIFTIILRLAIFCLKGNDHSLYLTNFIICRNVKTSKDGTMYEH